MGVKESFFLNDTKWSEKFIDDIKIIQKGLIGSVFAKFPGKCYFFMLRIFSSREFVSY